MKAAAHITGGGLPGNIVRVLPDSVAIDVDASSWTIPPVFGWISTVVTYLFTVGDVNDLTFPCTSHSTGESLFTIFPTLQIDRLLTHVYN